MLQILLSKLGLDEKVLTKSAEKDEIWTASAIKDITVPNYSSKLFVTIYHYLLNICMLTN